jgi:hypothetical protein
VSIRLTLDEIRDEVLLLLSFDDRWWSQTDVHRAISNSGNEWYRVALVLERLASDGEIQRKVNGRVRRFRRKRVLEPVARVHGPPRFDDDDNPFIHDAAERRGRSTTP